MDGILLYGSTPTDQYSILFLFYLPRRCTVGQCFVSEVDITAGCATSTTGTCDSDGMSGSACYTLQVDRQGTVRDQQGGATCRSSLYFPIAGSHQDACYVRGALYCFWGRSLEAIDTSTETCFRTKTNVVPGGQFRDLKYKHDN